MSVDVDAPAFSPDVLTRDEAEEFYAADGLKPCHLMHEGEALCGASPPVWGLPIDGLTNPFGPECESCGHPRCAACIAEGER